MSIFTRQIFELTYNDVKELLEQGAEENIRLEFKQEHPGKFNLIKKISAFANTYGGFVIIGAEENGRGQLKALKGIEPISRFDQKIVQWCFEEIYPPIMPFISPPIPVPGDSDRVIYVIYVEQSLETPHILNKSRNGLYVRTDEYSQKFLTRLAKFDELDYLMEKRRKADIFRKELIARAERRLSVHKEIRYQEHLGTDSLLKLSLIPVFPGNRSFLPEKLISYAQNSGIKARGAIAPDFSSEHIHSQFESIISENPGVGYYSYFEINIYNMLYYVCDVTREYGKTSSGRSVPRAVIPLKVLMAEIILFLRFAWNFYKQSGYAGLLNFTAGMENIKGRRLSFKGDYSDPGENISYLDNTMELHKTCSSRQLIDYESISIEIFKELCFSLGYKEIYTLPGEQISAFFKGGLSYLNKEMKNE